MRVLVVDHTGGVVPFQRKFAALAAQPGIELSVLVPSRWVENYRTIRARPDRRDGYRLFTGSVVWPGYENRGFFVSGVVRALRAADPDVIHLWEEPFSLFALQTLLLARVWAPRARTLFSSSDDLSRNFRYPYRPSWAYAWIERFTEARCDAATVVNEQVRALLRDKGFRRPIERITHGLDLELYPCSLRERAARAREPERHPQVVGCVGRLLPQKGVDVLLRAFALLKPADDGVAPELRVLGEGPDRQRLQTLVGELGLGDRVRFLSNVPHGEVASIYADLDILVVPSRTTPKWVEHFGRVLIEGMAAGCVVIGSDSGAIPEVLGDAGIVVPEGNPGALAAAISRVLDDRELASVLRTRGRERVRERYTWEEIATRLAEFYGRILSEPVRGATERARARP